MKILPIELRLHFSLLTIDLLMWEMFPILLAGTCQAILSRLVTALAKTCKPCQSMEEMDPVEAEVQLGGVFIKNLSEYVEQSELNKGGNSDNDDTDSGVLISPSAENCNEELKKLEQDIALYLQALQKDDCKVEILRANYNEDTKIDLNQNKENTVDHLGIPEISFEAATSRPASPCPPGEDEYVDNKTDISQGEEKDKQEDGMDEKDFVATDEDWDKMEALAHKEQEEEEEIVENKENKAK